MLRVYFYSRQGCRNNLYTSQHLCMFQYIYGNIFHFIIIISNIMNHAHKNLLGTSIFRRASMASYPSKRSLNKSVNFGLSSLSYHMDMGFCQYIGGSSGISQPQGKEQVCDFGRFEDPNAKIESMIILNNELNYNLLSYSMKLTENIVLADGGANYLYEIDKGHRNSKIKALIGDFDCIKPEVLDFYSKLKIPIQYLSNPETNDFAKSLEFCLENNWKEIFVFGAFGGRMDHTLSYMHYCQKYFKTNPELRITLFGQSNLMHFMRPNIPHKICFHEKFISRFGCGIISFGQVNSVETTGFKYNLGEEQKYNRIQWGQFISTSNTMIEEQCTIKGSDSLFLVINYSKQMLKQ